MSTESIAALVGAVVGAVLTFVLSQFAVWFSERKKQKLLVLGGLMGGRGRIFSQDVSDVINLIPVVFSGDTRVRNAYQHFCAIRSSTEPQFFPRYADLVLAVAKSAGFRERLTEADIYLGFFPTQPAATNTPPKPET